MMTVQEDYILLQAEGLNLLLPQTDIAQVLHIDLRLVKESNIATSIAQLETSRSSDRDYYVSLSSDLKLQSSLDLTRFVQTTWRIAPNIHWCWSNVSFIGHAFSDISPMPEVFHILGSPLTSIASLENEKETCGYISNSEMLLDYLLSRGDV